MAVVRQVINGNYPIIAVLKNGETRVFNDYEEIYAHLMDLAYDEDDSITVDGLILHGTKVGGLGRFFGSNQYSRLPVHERIVIDIGAGIGDSSAYFVKQGAKRVIAIEPNEELCALAKRNIQANNYLNTIELIHAGVSCRGEGRGPLTLMRLSDIVDKYCHNSYDLILKIDCEGCEYDAVLNSCYDTFAHFSYIQIEYHHGYRNIKEKLEEFGFEVHITGPFFLRPFDKTTSTVYYYNNSGRSRIDKAFVGMIFAERINDT